MDAVPANTAFEVGRILGASFALLLALGCTAKCIEVLRRPTADGRCLGALLLVCVAGLVSILASLTTQLLGPGAERLRLLGGLLALPVLLAALVLAIVGLALHDPTRHRQGRTQAIWALVVSIWALVAVLGILAGRGVEVVPAGSPALVSKPEHNFELACSRPWVSLAPEVINAEACVALRRTRPEMACMVIAERVGDAFDQAGLVELSMANLQSAAELLERRDEEVRLGGHAFARVRTRARVIQVDQVLAYEHWILVHRGFAWQIIAWAAEAERDRLAREVRAIVETFRVLDPERDGSGPGTLADVARPELGTRPGSRARAGTPGPISGRRCRWRTSAPSARSRRWWSPRSRWTATRPRWKRWRRACSPGSTSSTRTGATTARARGSRATAPRAGSSRPSARSRARSTPTSCAWRARAARPTCWPAGPRRRAATWSSCGARSTASTCARRRGRFRPPVRNSGSHADTRGTTPASRSTRATSSRTRRPASRAPSSRAGIRSCSTTGPRRWRSWAASSRRASGSSRSSTPSRTPSTSTCGTPGS